MVAGVGLEPHDLRVMSPTSYQLLYPALKAIIKLLVATFSKTLVASGYTRFARAA